MPENAHLSQARSLHEGTHVALLEKDGWEFAHRRNGHGVVVVVALTDAREIVLVEQYRPPVGRRVIELPAGLVGDDREETVLEAGARELEEESGYRAGEIRTLWSGPTSAGLADEIVTMLVAQALERVHDGGGVDDEQIQVHLVPLPHLEIWLCDRENSGTLVDLKVRLAPKALEAHA